MSRFAAMLVLFLGSLTAVAAEDVWLTNATIIPGNGELPRAGVHLRIAGGRIAQISERAPSAGQRIDLGGAFVLPGFIDAHAHIEDPASARRALDAGVTTVRVLGDAYLKGLGTRDLIRQGSVSGPELLVSGGHVRPRLGEAFFLAYPQFGRYIDTPLAGAANVREVVAAVIARGADVIKVGASERAGLATTEPRRSELSYEELRAAVEEAARSGRFVAAHAHGRDGANAAVRAGVRSIEHGTWLDEATLDLMADQGTFFVPTLAIMSPLGDPRGDSADAIALQIRTHHMHRPLRDAVRKAHARGIVIAAGSDGSYGDGDDTARVRPAHEVEELVACGLTPMQAIVAATHNAARVLGIEHRTGTVATGMEADLLVVERDPLLDTTTLFEPMLVINDGVIVLDRLADVVR